MTLYLKALAMETEIKLKKKKQCVSYGNYKYIKIEKLLSKVTISVY